MRNHRDWQMVANVQYEIDCVLESGFNGNLTSRYIIFISLYAFDRRQFLSFAESRAFVAILVI